MNQPFATAIQLFLGSLVACSVAACSTLTQPAQTSPVPPTETAFPVTTAVSVYVATPDWKQYHSDSLIDKVVRKRTIEVWQSENSH
jgi:hypothetical protein